MYLSRMQLDENKRETMMALVSPNRFHGAIETAFPGERKRNLWRIDRINGKLYILIVSEGIPNLTAAVRQFGVDATPGWETKNYDLLLDRIQKDTVWRFRLTANPTYVRTNEHGQKIIHAHVTPEHQVQWLVNKIDKAGAIVKKLDISQAENPVYNVSVTEDRVISFKKRGARLVTFRMVSFEGVLTVTDPDIFRKALTDGIGREKAYGNGLITVCFQGTS